MFNEVFNEVLTKEGVVSITTWANDNAHVSNTWNSYLEIVEGNKILIPAAWLNKTERNIILNNQVILTLGSIEVQGKMGMGTGFIVKGIGKFVDSGTNFDLMKEKFSFVSRVLEVEVQEVRQTI